MNRLKKAWFKIPKKWRLEMMSAFHTFVPAFVGALLISYQVSGDFTWTKEALLAVLLSALRAGFKAVSVWFFGRVGTTKDV